MRADPHKNVSNAMYNAGGEYKYIDRRKVLPLFGVGIGSMLSLFYNVKSYAIDVLTESKNIVNLTTNQAIPESNDLFQSYSEYRFICYVDKAGFRVCSALPHGLPSNNKINFVTWSLFLIGNNEWLESKKSDNIEKLYEAYGGFSKAIGNRNAAVWFWKANTKLDKKMKPKEFVESFDAARCMFFYEKIKLDASKGPHLVITRIHPMLLSGIEKCAVISLNDLSAESISSILNRAASQIQSDKLEQADLDAERTWFYWKDTVFKLISTAVSMLSRLEVSLNAGILEIKKPSQGDSKSE